jgi:glycine cleavage system protein P-like pyridoxal-binding family
MQAIRREIADIANGRIKVEDSPLKAAPHTWDMCFKDEWTKPYTREQVHTLFTHSYYTYTMYVMHSFSIALLDGVKAYC